MPTPALIRDGQPTLFDFIALADANSTLLVKSGRGFIHGLTPTGGTSGTIVLYDNTEASGTIIADYGAAAFTFSGVEGSVRAEFQPLDIAFQTGLVISTTAVDSPRVTISYK